MWWKKSIVIDAQSISKEGVGAVSSPRRVNGRCPLTDMEPAAETSSEKVRRQRQRSSVWRATEQRRLQQIYARCQTPALTTHIPQIYTWSEQEQVSAAAGTSSGAAAVIHKRSRPTVTATHDTSTAQRPRKRPAVAASSPEQTRERRTDGQLIFVTNAHRLYVARITRWRWWPRTGDG